MDTLSLSINHSDKGLRYVLRINPSSGKWKPRGKVEELLRSCGLRISALCLVLRFILQRRFVPGSYSKSHLITRKPVDICVGIRLLSPLKCFFQLSIFLYSSRVPVVTSLYVPLFILFLCTFLNVFFLIVESRWYW